MKNHILMAMCFWFGLSAAHAQDNKQLSPISLTLSQAVDVAWQRAISAKEASGLVNRQTAEKIAAQRYWAKSPSIELSRREDRHQTNSGAQETEIGISVPIWLWGQRKAQNDLATSSLDKAKLNLAAVRLHIAGEVREAIWALNEAEANYEQITFLLQNLSSVLHDVDRRVKAGDLARSDSMIAQSEQLAALSSQSEAALQLKAQKSRWATLMGSALPLATQVSAELPHANSSISNHPFFLLATQATDEARKKLSLAEISKRDTPELKFGMRQDISAKSLPSQKSLQIALRIPLGSADRHLPVLAAALSELEVASAQEMRTLEYLMSEHQLAKEGLSNANLQLQSAKQRSDLLTERTQLIEKSFKAGETSLPDYLRAMSMSTSAQNAYQRQIIKTHLAIARFNQSLGVTP